jgi:hypothetical protein
VSLFLPKAEWKSPSFACRRPRPGAFRCKAAHSLPARQGQPRNSLPEAEQQGEDRQSDQQRCDRPFCTKQLVSSRCTSLHRIKERTRYRGSVSSLALIAVHHGTGGVSENVRPSASQSSLEKPWAGPDLFPCNPRNERFRIALTLRVAASAQPPSQRCGHQREPRAELKKQPGLLLARSLV